MEVTFTKRFKLSDEEKAQGWKLWYSINDQDLYDWAWRAEEGIGEYEVLDSYYDEDYGETYSTIKYKEPKE